MGLLVVGISGLVVWWFGAVAYGWFVACLIWLFDVAFATCLGWAWSLTWIVGFGGRLLLFGIA